MFLSANAGKRSLALSLRDPRGRDVLLRLADDADVFLQSLRPGLAEELGLGAEALRARNPRLVYCSVGAYGRVGPLAREPGYDALMQAAGGLISITGEPGRPGVRVGSSLIDQGTGHVGGARRARGAPRARADGRGRAWSTSRSTRRRSGTSATTSPGYLADGTIPRGDGTRFPMVAPYQVFPTRDGELMIARRQRPAVRARSATSLEAARARRRPALPRRIRERVRNRDALADLLDERLRSGDSARLAGAPHAPRASRPRRSPTSATSPSRRRPRRSGSSSALAAPTHRRAAAPRPPALVRRRARASTERAAGRRRALRRRCSARQAIDDAEIAALAAGRGDPRMSVTSPPRSARRSGSASRTHPGSFARLAQAIGDAGGSLGAIDLVRVEARHEDARRHRRRRRTPTTSQRIVEAVRAVDGVEVEHVSDRTFLMHLGGKLEVRAEVAAEDARRPLDGVHAGRRPDLHGDRRATARRPGT